MPVTGQIGKVAGLLVLGASLLSIAGMQQKAFAQAPGAKPRNVIIFVTDGLRAGSVNEVDSPTIYSLENRGVKFINSHSLFPTFTTPNASAIATGHYLGDTGDFSNVLYSGYPVFNKGDYGNSAGSNTPALENDQVLGDIDDHFGGNYLTEESLLAYARTHGYSTAAVGKTGPTLIQDVTEGNIDPTTGKAAAPITIIIDDATGTAAGIPLSDTIAAALISAGLGTKAPSRGANGQPGTSTSPGTLVPNLAQQQYYADAVTKVILPSFKASEKPFAMVFWSRDPDGTQHNQGDSLNSLTPGINGPTSKAAIKNVDTNLQQILNYVNENGMAATTDIFVIADHGFSTISHHEVNMTGAVTSSYSTTFTYKDLKGRQEVNTGFTPTGFVAIDLAHAFNLPLFDPDSQIKSNGTNVFEPVDPTIGQQTAAERQHPVNGDGLLGGTGTISTPTDAQIVIAANGGSDLIYVPNGSLSARTDIGETDCRFPQQAGLYQRAVH
jgi:arylsulfatase A-like enzyme